jgi:hypothetical protein
MTPQHPTGTTMPPRRVPATGAVRRRFVAALAALALTLATGLTPIGCARAKRAVSGAAGDTEPVEPVSVQVQNRHGADVVVYALRGNTRTRLGTVSTGSSQNFVLPMVFVGDIGGFFLIGDPIGTRGGVQSERIVVQGGQRVVWSLEARLAQSSIGIY